MLSPEEIGMSGALDDTVDVLNVGIVRLFGRHVCGPDAVGAAVPGTAAIGRDPNATAGNADRNVSRVARIDADRVDAWQIGAAAKPLFSFRIEPERLDKLPSGPVVGRS